MILLLVGVAFVCLIVYQYWHFRTHYPKGPWPLPFVGNSLALRGVGRWEDKFLEWKQQYGPVYTFVSSMIPIVTVNDYKLIQETFVRDGDAYADRYNLKEFDKLTRGGEYGIINTNGDLWREQRRFTLRVLRDFGLGKSKMEERILDEVQSMCDRVNAELKASGAGREMDFHKYTDLAIGSVINSVICGYRFTTDDKEEEFYRLKEGINKMMKVFSDPLLAIAIFSSVVRKIPPFSTKFNKGIAYFNDIFKFLDGVIEQHKKQNDYTSLAEPRDFIDAFLMEKVKGEERGEAHYFSDAQLRNVCVDLWFAGQETSTNTLTWCIAYMIRNPDVQEKLHEELDRVIGSDRLIGTADKSNLPYAQAVLAETQRCANIVSINSLRTTTREVTLGGCRLPKGTIVIPQISVLMIDPEIFPEPKRFNPSRFIDENGRFRPAEEIMPFSVGKRQCPGEGLARVELFLFIVNLFNQYKFYAGEEPPSLLKEYNGASMATKPYKCRVERRYP